MGSSLREVLIHAGVKEGTISTQEDEEIIFSGLRARAVALASYYNYLARIIRFSLISNNTISNTYFILTQQNVS